MRGQVLNVSVALVLLSAPLCAQVAPQPDFGAYLAASTALRSGDFAAVAEYGAEALASDISDSGMLLAVAEAQMMLGEIDGAMATVSLLQDPDRRSHPIVEMLMLDQALREQDYESLTLRLSNGPKLNPVFDQVLLAWVTFGKGRLEQSLSHLDVLQRQRGEVGAIGHYHEALMLRLIGDTVGALEALEAGGSFALGEESLSLHVALLVELDRLDDAYALMAQVDPNGESPELAQLKAQIETGEKLPEFGVTSEREAIARAYLSVANAMRRDDLVADTLRYARMAEIMEPTLTSASILLADALQSVELDDLAIDAYLRVSDQSARQEGAQLRAARLMAMGGADEEALALLSKLAAENPDSAEVLTALGDQLRRMDRFEDAIPAYSRALSELGDKASWFSHFAYGVALERAGQWPSAEAAFRQSLSKSPDQPIVLNYLGYSLVEKGGDLNEALDMIERAVAADPDSGAIVDSLGWVYYRLGRYDEAVEQLERAASLEPDDPVINDHLGDALWKVGRVREARFQWRRALSFGPEPEEAALIRNKLENGLDEAANPGSSAPELMVAP